MRVTGKINKHHHEPLKAKKKAEDEKRKIEEREMLAGAGQLERADAALEGSADDSHYLPSPDPKTAQRQQKDLVDTANAAAAAQVAAEVPVPAADEGETMKVKDNDSAPLDAAAAERENLRSRRAADSFPPGSSAATGAADSDADAAVDVDPELVKAARAAPRLVPDSAKVAGKERGKTDRHSRTETERVPQCVK
jgi:hypothetical protein